MPIDDCPEHPLFLTKSPASGDFETNAALGALAALIDEGDDEKKGGERVGSPPLKGNRDDAHMSGTTEVRVEEEQWLETHAPPSPFMFVHHQQTRAALPKHRRSQPSSAAPPRRGRPPMGSSGSGAGAERRDRRDGRRAQPYAAPSVSAVRTRATLGQVQICLALSGI